MEANHLLKNTPTLSAISLNAIFDLSHYNITNIIASPPLIATIQTMSIYIIYST